MFVFNRITITLGISSFLFTANLLASNELASNETGRIVNDENILIPVNAEHANDPRMRAIGLLKLGCTVTHVGNGIAITAGHCFARDNFEGMREKLPCDGPKSSIRWGLTYGSEGYMTSKCTEVIATEYNEERDYAIFRVSPIPSSYIEVSHNTLSLEDAITIYSHPHKRPLEWSQWCKVEGFLDSSLGNEFYYSCNTEPGSSGAAILDKDFKIVGIHDKYDPDHNRNAATMLSVTPLLNILAESGVASL